MNSDAALTRWTARAARDWVAMPQPGDDKYSRGVLGVITGSDRYPGAAVLGVQAAARTGVGMVRYVGPSRAADFVLHRRPEVVTASGRVQAWLIGSGMDPKHRDEAAAAALHDAIDQKLPTVIDAGALDLIPDAQGPVVATPHYRELVGMLGRLGTDASVQDIAADPAEWAGRAAAELGVVVLIKGYTSHIVAPDGERLSASGPAWLATAGTGDVLGGILGALLATHTAAIAEQGSHALVRLAATACVLQSLAATRASAGGPIVALDVADNLGGTIAALLEAELLE